MSARTAKAARRILTDELTHILAALAALLLGIVVVALSDDVEEWNPTDDPACVIHEKWDNSLFRDDTATYTRYCKEAS